MSAIRTGKAIQDLIEHYAYIGMDRPDAAEHFVSAAEQAFRDLVQMPNMGRLREVPNVHLTGLR